MSILYMDLSVLEQPCLFKLLVLLANFKILASTLIITTAILYLLFKSNHVYLIDFMCYRAPDTNRVPTSSFREHIERWEVFDTDSVEFQAKLLEKSGIGSESYFPPGIHLLPHDQSLNATLEEVQMVFFTVVQNLFSKHKIDPKSIDILVTNCSVVCPTPSLASMIINKFGFRSNILSFNLSGMGCSANLISVSLAKDLLKVHKNSLALILSTESVCSNIYHGKVKSMLLSNCLFRMGGAAALLSNRKGDKRVAKYELKHLVRTHTAAKDICYKCITQEPDNEGITGAYLSKSLEQLAGETLKLNLAKLAVLVLPYSEQIKYVLSVAWRRIWPPARKGDPYMPDFKEAFDHFCIHSGGKSIIQNVKKQLKLREKDIEPSKMTLYKFGNTSSASTWYALGYLEAKGRVNKGDRLWQLALGSGLKCNSAVWKCIRNPEPESYNVWSDYIQKYPVEVPDVIKY